MKIINNLINFKLLMVSSLNSLFFNHPSNLKDRLENKNAPVPIHTIAKNINNRYPRGKSF